MCCVGLRGGWQYVFKRTWKNKFEEIKEDNAKNMKCNSNQFPQEIKQKHPTPAKNNPLNQTYK